MPLPHRSLLPVVALALVAAGCSTGEETANGGTGGATLTVYSGRSEDLVQPLFDRFEKQTGTEVEVRYGSSAELAAQLLEEGERTEADAFLSQDAGALGALTKRELLAELPQPTRERVDARFRADDGTWVGLSGRARVLAYDEAKVTDVPTSVFELTEPAWKGKVAYAPTNASFQSFVTAMRVLEGERRTTQWLRDFAANEPVAYESNGEILRAVDAGQVPLGMINHYYWYELEAEEGTDVTAGIGWLDQGDPGALVNVAGIGVLEGSEQAGTAEELVDFLLADEQQTYFAEETSEYPLVDGVPQSADLPPLAEVSGPDIDLSDLDSLDETLAGLEEVGIL